MFTKEELIEIANALNGEAKKFDEHAATLTNAPEDTRAIWRAHAEQLRALARKAIDALPQ